MLLNITFLFFFFLFFFLLHLLVVICFSFTCLMLLSICLRGEFERRGTETTGAQLTYVTLGSHWCAYRLSKAH